MKKILFVSIFVVAALTLSACNNKMAARPAVWYNPLSWGDRTVDDTYALAQADCESRDEVLTWVYSTGTDWICSPAQTEEPVVESTPMPGTESPLPVDTEAPPVETEAPLETQVVVTGFPDNPAEVIALFNIRGITASDVSPCPFEDGDCWEIKVSPFLIDNPWSCWLEAFREIPGEVRPGDYTHTELSGVPPLSKDVLIDSGVTIRSCEDYAAAPTPGPLAVDQSIGDVLPGFPDTAEMAAEMLQIDLEVAGPWACGEINCFIFRPKAPNVSFNVNNTSSCWQDGLRLVDGEIRPGFENEPGATRISIPRGYDGPVDEIVFRPCLEEVREEPIVTVAGFPTTAEEVVSMFQIENGVVSGCSGESNCWQVNPSVAGGFFHITNTSGCWLTGYTREPHEMWEGQSDPKTGIPINFDGEAEAAQIRPCQVDP